MATVVWPELTNIQDEDVLRRMWQETEDFGRKKEIRARMYKIREQRLKDFYTTGDVQSEVSVRKTKTHTESIGDQGSFLTMKSKEIRDSESPTRDITCARRGETWSSNFKEDKIGGQSDNKALVHIQQSSAPESVQVLESSALTSGRVSSQQFSSQQRVAKSSSVQTSTQSSQSVTQSSQRRIGEITGDNTQITSGQEIATRSNVISSGNQGNVSSSEIQRVSSSSQRASSESRVQQEGGQVVTTRRIVKQSRSGSPGEVVTTTVTTHTSSDSSQPPSQTTSARVIKGDDTTGDFQRDNNQNRSSIFETTTVAKSEPEIFGFTESTSNKQVQQSRQSATSTYSTQSVTSSVQKSSSSVEKQNQNVSVSNRTVDNQMLDSVASTDRRNMVTSTSNDSQRFITQEQQNVSRVIKSSSDNRASQITNDQNLNRSEQVQITEVDTSDTNVNNLSNITRKDSKVNIKREVNKTSDTVDSQRKVTTDMADSQKKITSDMVDSQRKITTDLVDSQRKITADVNTSLSKATDAVDSQKKITTDVKTSHVSTVDNSRNKNEDVRLKSTSSTDQKIMSEIQKLDTYLSTQPTPSSSVPMSPAPSSNIDWPIDKEFVYTDTAPRDKVLVNGERSTPIRHPANLELPKGATEGQYVTTYQHDYSPRVSRDHDTNHQYFASTLRASPDRSSPSPSKRSSSKGSLDRSTPDRKFRGSPTRKTPDIERRLSSSSYTIERISDSKRYNTDVTEKSQTLPKDMKPKRKLSSTQTKAANKTRVSTPGASPTTSPTRAQRGRKPSSSESDSDHSNATFNKKTSILRNSGADDTKKYSSTTRIRDSSTSINITDNETRPFSSPSPTRHPARENTPDYSSEGSITRELRTARNTEKIATTLDSSPERSAFSPIKGFRTSPERRDHTMDLINEERKHIVQTNNSFDNSVDEVDINNRTVKTTETDSTIKEINRVTKTPDSSPERTLKNQQTVISDSVKVTESKKRTASTSSPERQVRKDKSEPKKPENESQRKPKTPVNSPERRSPSKADKNVPAGRQSPTKPKYQSPVSNNQKVPDYSKPKSSSVVIEKTTSIKKGTKTDGDRITRRSSIPRAEITQKSSPRGIKEPDNKTKPSFTRNTASSVTRTTTKTTSTLHHPAKTTVAKIPDRSSIPQTRDVKSASAKKPDAPALKRPVSSKKPDSEPQTKISPNVRPKTKTPTRPKTEIPVKTAKPLVNGRMDNTTKTSSTIRRDQEVKTTKAKKEITHTDSKEIIKTKLKDYTQDDKDSSESIEDEQPPEEFYDYLDDRDTTDDVKPSDYDSTNFKRHETDVTQTCERTTKIIESTRNKKNIDSSMNLISAEQNYSSPTKTPGGHEISPAKKPQSSKPVKPKDSMKPSKKKPSERKDKHDDSSSSSSDEEVKIKYDDFSDTRHSETHQIKITKRDVSKDSDVREKSKVDTLKVHIQHPKSSRESSPEKSIPMSVTSDGSQTPRYADFVTEPEDVEVFDSTNLGPNRPIPSTLLDENRIIEESDDSTREVEKVSVADRVSKYIQKTNKIDIVTLDTSKQQNIDTSSDVSRTKELFENITKQPEDSPTVERRGSKKYDEVNEFIQKESDDNIRTNETAARKQTVDVTDKAYTSKTVKREIVQQQQSPTTQKPGPKKQPSNDEMVKKPERRLSEHSPDIESKMAFFERKSKDTVITETVQPSPTREPIKSSTPFDQKVPNYMKDTETAATRKETIQREFAPTRQDSEKDLNLIVKEKRSSIDIEKMDAFIKSEMYDVSKESNAPATPYTSVRDVSKHRRSSVEVQELDTFKKAEAYHVCDDKTRSVPEKKSSISSLKNVTSSSVVRKESTITTDVKRKQSQSKSPERSPTRKTSKDMPNDRMPLKKKDTNIMTEERTSETKTSGKFGVTLRRTSSSGVSSTPKPQNEVVLPDDLPEIEEIFNLTILEVLMTRAVLYDERRRIRAQIRIVKKNLESEQNQQPNRRPQSTLKTDRGVKEDTYQKRVTTSVEKTSTSARTPSPTKDFKTPKRVSPERRTVSDRKESQRNYEERKISTDKNSSTIHSVKSYTSPDKSYSVKETRTETRRVSPAKSPERRSNITVETVTRKSTPYPMMSSERRTSSNFETRVESHSTYSRSSPERKIREEESRKSGSYSSSPSPERRPTSKDYERRSDKSSPERKTKNYDSRRTSDTIKTYSGTSPDRKTSKDFENISYSTKKTEERTSEMRRSSRTSPERKISADYQTRRTSETKSHSRTSPDRKLSTDTTESSRTSSHTVKTSTHYTTTTTSSVGRKGEDSITSSYGVGPTDSHGRPLFGLRALRSSKQTTDDISEIEVGEDVGDGLADDVKGTDGRPLFGLKALKAVTTTTTSSTVTSSAEMPSTQHLVQKHQQFLSEVKSSEEKVRSDVPRAKLRNSFILDSDEGATSVVPALAQPHGVSLKSIIQKHEDIATSGKNVRREVQSTKTVMSSHGTVSSDGKVSLTKHLTHGEMRGKDGAEPTGRITTSQYTYKSSDDPLQKPHVTSTTTTTHLGNNTHRNSITSIGEVKIEEILDSESRRDSLVSSARKSLENKQREDGKQSDQSWQAERKTVVRGDSIKALQHKFQQPTVSSSMKRVGGEEVRTTKVEERRSSVKDDKEDASSRISSRTTTTVSSSSVRRDSGMGNGISSTNHTTTTTREGSKSATSFLDDTSKVTGVQDILQRMRNADLVTEGSDTTEDSEARSLLNKFLGASVILQGMEAGGAGPASSALVSQVERQRILTSTQRKTDDIDNITDEKQLQILLEACSDYEQRRKIRARLRKIMAVRKGQGEMMGGEEGEERREEYSESRQITSNDGGSFTKTEVHKTSSSSARLTKANSVQQSPFAKFRQLERQNSAPSGGALFKLTDPKLVRSASTIKDRLLCWARAQTSGYKNVQIDNFSTSWSNGLAFCALIHHFYPDAFDYNELTPESRRHNFELAFRIAEEKGDIYPLLDVDDMVAMRKPDWKCVFTYVQSMYRRLHNEPNAVKSI